MFQDVDRVLEEQNKQKKQEIKEIIETSSKKKYDPFKREPKYSNAKDSAIFELI